MMKLNKSHKIALKFLVAIFLVQLFATFNTNTQKFSIQAFMRNLLWGFSFYKLYYSWNPLWLFLPIIFNIILNISSYYIFKFRIQPYITTEYLYNDYFEYIVKDNPMLNYYSEGSYGKFLGIDTLNESPENIKKIKEWGIKQYNNAHNDIKMSGFNNEPISPEKIMKQSQNEKFKWIINNTHINQHSRVLEIGFGKLDFMKFVRSHTGATVEGANLSNEHLKQAKENGFKTHAVDYSNLKHHIDEMGQFDLIVTNGSLEYVWNIGDKETVYRDIMKTIQKLLKPNGKWYAATIHLIPKLCIKNIFDPNHYNHYVLAFGNEGGYPIDTNGLTRFADESNLAVHKQQTGWLDYYVYCIFWMYFHIKALKKNRHIFKHLNAYIAAPNYLESYLCYTPLKSIFYQPWVWQFMPHDNGCVPTKHQWIIFENKLNK